MASWPDTAAIDAVCAFERFYEKRLRDFYKASLVQESSWAEINVMMLLKRFEPGGVSASCIYGWLSLDSGYPDTQDRRCRQFALSDRGRKTAAGLLEFHRERVRDCLINIAPWRLRKLVAAMTYIQHILTRSPIDHLIESYEPRRMRVATRRVRARPRPSSPRRRG